MSDGVGRFEIWRSAWREAGNWKTRLQWLVEYAGLRAWSTVISCFPMELNLQTARLFGRAWWMISAKHRARAMDNLRPAFGTQLSEAAMLKIARDSFEHFAQVYLVELILTPRLVNEWSWPRYVELGNVEPALRQLLTGGATIMLTPHFGNFELMGYTIARLGLPISAVMRSLDNSLVMDMVISAREAGGLHLLEKRGAMEDAPRILDQGGTVCFIADQDAGKKGVFSMFFNRKASWYKSIGLLAMQKRTPLVIGQMVRVERGFRYRMEVERIVQPAEWDLQDNPLQWITDTFAAAFEAAIRRHPEQYLWMHRRWKTRPKGEVDPVR